MTDGLSQIFGGIGAITIGIIILVAAYSLASPVGAYIVTTALVIAGLAKIVRGIGSMVEA